jgi:hypothetical protein
MPNCIALITKEPNPSWMDFLKDFKEHDVYLIIDENSVDYTDVYKSKYPTLNFIQIKNDECADNYFTNSSTTTGMGSIISWDKALYYFSNLNTKYDNVWFIEDDVFFYGESTITELDNKYENSDILVSKCELKKPAEWLWSRIHIGFPEPHYCGMVCAVRMSSTLLYHIDQYARANKSLFCLEAMFISIAMYKGLKLDIPDELKTIVYQKDWQVPEINKMNLYHPVKSINRRNEFRERLDGTFKEPIVTEKPKPSGGISFNLLDPNITFTLKN